LIKYDTGSQITINTLTNSYFLLANEHKIHDYCFSSHLTACG
jgi:hypothetical protein